MLNPLSAMTESPSSSRSTCLCDFPVTGAPSPKVGEKAKVARGGDSYKGLDGVMLFIFTPCGSLSIRGSWFLNVHFSTINNNSYIWVLLEGALISSLLGQHTSVSLKIEARKQTQVVNIRLSCDYETENT